MAGIEKYYEITEVYGWQWDGNTNIKHEYKNRGYSGRNKKRSHYAKD